MNLQTKHHGFTLIEALVSIGVISLIGLAIVAFQKSVIQNSKVMQASLTSQQQVRKTLKSFSAEIRSAMPSETGAYAVATSSTSSIMFYANIDGGPEVELVHYFLATSTSPVVFDVLKKGVTKPTGTTYIASTESVTTLIRDIKNSSSSPLFSYYDANYAGTSTPLSTSPLNLNLIRLVKITILVDPNSSRSPFPQTYTTSVALRNLKTNF